MSTAVCAPRARWSASPGVVLALSLFAAPATAGIAPLPAHQWDVAGIPQTQTRIPNLETVLRKNHADRLVNASEAIDLNAVERRDKAEPQAVGFEIFKPGSEVAGQSWPIGGVNDSRRAQNADLAAHDNRLPPESVGTVIPAPPALQSGLCAMGALGLVALGRRARRALR